MSITQSFYDQLAPQYDKLFLNWHADVQQQAALQVSRFECEYRATRRQELTDLLLAAGCSRVQWLMPQESGFYQPIVVAKKERGKPL